MPVRLVDLSHNLSVEEEGRNGGRLKSNGQQARASGRVAPQKALQPSMIPSPARTSATGVRRRFHTDTHGRLGPSHQLLTREQRFYHFARPPSVSLSLGESERKHADMAGLIIIISQCLLLCAVCYRMRFSSHTHSLFVLYVGKGDHGRGFMYVCMCSGLRGG